MAQRHRGTVAQWQEGGGEGEIKLCDSVKTPCNPWL